MVRKRNFSHIRHPELFHGLAIAQQTTTNQEGEEKRSSYLLISILLILRA
jgi:hypothetical protein